jgi:BCD family chlorophyll transporter-like MFS transporter
VSALAPASADKAASFGWLSIIRVGLVQTSLGAVVVLTTSTLNRVMVVELALPALVPGLLVTLHYAVQALRPRWGHGSDGGRRRTPWIIGGMAALCAGGALAALATALMSESLPAGAALAVVAFLLIGMGVGAAGTSLLTLLAERTEPARRAPAATIVWTMMIFGFALTATLAGHALDPFSPQRLVAVTSAVSLIAFALACLAIRGLETPAGAQAAPEAQRKTPFREAFAQVWEEPATRRFAWFIFVSMLAYNAQDLILEPFAGVVYAMTPGESTRLGGLQHGGVLAGMILAAGAGALAGAQETRVLRQIMIWGCVASGVAMAGVAAGAFIGPSWPIKPAVFALGVANGAFSIAAIGAMMAMARQGHPAREGVRMGLWGAAQAMAFALGGLAGAVGVDVARALIGAPAPAYGAVFACEAGLFLLAAALAAHVARDARSPQFTQTLEGAR